MTKITKKDTMTFLKEMLKKNATWALRALEVVNSNQTAEEQNYEQTIEANGEGFTGVDGEFGASLAKQYKDRGSLSDKQMTFVFKMMPKYWGQLLLVADMDKLNEKILGWKEGTYKIPTENNIKVKPKKTVALPHTITVDGNSIVIVYPFNKEINDALFNNKTFAMFDHTTKTRRIDIANAKRYNSLTGILRYLQMDFAKQFPQFVIDRSVVSLDAQTSIVKAVQKTAQITFNHLKLTPFDYQKAGIQFIEDCKGVAFIGDDMGLGKTMQAIGYTAFHNLKTLVVCPASLKLNWVAEVAKFTNNKTACVFNKKAPTTNDMLNNDYTVINYDIMKKNKDLLLSIGFDAIVCDESHYLKNPKAQRTVATVALIQSIDKKILLSGTAIKSRPIEFFTQLSAIRPDIYEFAKFTRFAYRYTNPVKHHFGTDFNGSANLDELYKKISEFYIRRNKVDVLKELPLKSRVVVPVEALPKTLSAYNKIMLDAKASKSPAAALTAIGKGKQLLSLSKLDSIVELAETIMENDEKVIIFSQYHETINQLKTILGDKAVTLTGKHSSDQKNDAVNSFQNDDNVKVIIGNIQAMGVGFTLTASSKVIFVDQPWTPGELLQAEDRSLRIGQTNAVTAYNFVTPNTIEETIMELLISKAKVLDAVLDGKQFTEGLEMNTSIQSELLKTL